MSDARHASDEVIDHAVGFGIGRIEAHELAVGDEIEACNSCVLRTVMTASRSTGREGFRDQPRQNGVGADDCGFDPGHASG